MKTNKPLKKDFLIEVMSEIDRIKSKATKEEISLLNFKSFNHYSSGSCIYGQMTGSCDSRRAEKLMRKSYANISLNLISKKDNFKDQDFQKGCCFTALEKYLYMVGATMHEKIIKYLKGEINELILK